MPRARRCSFCGTDFPPGTGIMYVRRDGSIQWYCSKKCRVSMMDFRRDPRKLKWTAYHGQRERGK
ncbi:MAG: 50S ribosomal protein L24e [Candidatus Bathyarchaeia archaeon]